LLCLAGCSSPGAFLDTNDGPLFTPHPLSDEDHALVYLYRPQSDWADQEIEAPGLFLNKNLIASLPSNSYVVLELDVASYPLEMRRPLFGSFWTALADGMFDFNRIAGFNLDVGAGGTYYLRYDELNPPPLAEGTPTLGDGPLQLVPASLAEKEIGATHEFQPPQRFAADGEREEEPGFWGALGL
jgi:hypothetical protein